MTHQLSGSISHTVRNRILSVDVLRGCAMVLVIFQHAYLSVNFQSIPPALDLFIWKITGIAAVAFVSISGMMYSYLLYTRPDWQTAYRRYTGRAAFLLLAAHPVINVVSYYFNAADKQYPSGYVEFLDLIVLNFPITDTIAFCLLASPVFVVITGHMRRAAVISAMLLLAVFIRSSMFPADLHWAIFKEVTFGGLGEPKVFWFPLIPWLAIFLSGSFAGYALACHKKGTLGVSAMVKMINKGGLFLALCGAVLVLGYKLLKMTMGSTWNNNIFIAIYPGQTTTLLPVYLAALALLFAVFLKEVDISGRYNRLFWLLSVFGRTSLFTFVLQFAVVESVPALLGMKGTLGLLEFIVLFVIGSMLIWLLAYLYGRWRGWISDQDYAICVNVARARIPYA